MQALENRLSEVADIAVKAGLEILEVYRCTGALQVSFKADDSPLTETDTRAC
jgi:3'-phosphoadenosine 5'-phosphosulfate (PAPS) 3'-phosphatase